MLVLVLTLKGTERHRALTIAGRAEKGTSTITSKADGKHSTKFMNFLTSHLDPCVMLVFLIVMLELSCLKPKYLMIVLIFCLCFKLTSIFRLSSKH